jgi:hypothetical protein
MGYNEKKSEYSKKYVNAVYNSGRADLIEKLEEAIGFISQIPRERLTLKNAIRAIKSDLRNIMFIRKELQENQEFLEVFSENLVKRTLRIKEKGDTLFDIIKFSTMDLIYKDFFENEELELADEVAILIRFYIK